MSGYNSCLGTNVSGNLRVKAQSCMGTNVVEPFTYRYRVTKKNIFVRMRRFFLTADIILYVYLAKYK